MMNTFKRALLAGVGAAVITKEKAEASLRDFVAQGRVNAADARALARQLAREINITAMIDLSDGLSRDIRHVCQESGVGARIDANMLPVHEDVAAVQREGWSVFEHAAHDGEDYELLFTCPTTNHPAAYPIGQITEQRDVLWRFGGGVVPLEPRGWEHRF